MIYEGSLLNKMLRHLTINKDTTLIVQRGQYEA